MPRSREAAHDACREGALQHRSGQLRLRRKTHLLGRTGFLAARSVLCPLAREVEFPIQQDRPLGRRIGPPPPIWQFSMRPVVPLYSRLTPTDFVPCFQKAGLVDNQHRTRVAQMLQRVHA
jgi:hypothetical protein